CEGAVMRCEKSPRAIASLAATISRNGDVSPRDRKNTTTRAMIAAMTPLTDAHIPSRTPAQKTTTVTATAARMTTLSLSLSVGSGSSGRSGGRFTVIPCAWPSRGTVLDCVTDTVHRAHDIGPELATNR